MIAPFDHPNRFVRLRCPLCGHTSPTCDQSTDVRRDLLSRWWDEHVRTTHRPSPIVERAEPPATHNEQGNAQ